MITTLSIKCPHCEQVSQIFLSTSVCVIILNCPSCLSPIMYFKHKIFLLDPKQLKRLTSDTRSSMLSKLLEKITDSEATAQCGVKKTASAYHQAAGMVSTAHKVTATDRCEKYITDDDCTNLRIELELCHDSLDFINRL
ncbi:MAG: hypothetical protein JXA71_13425 [Chitinispirillaceae bacterium]|nr:hypothetical protein [Chitinispirillaceae bacterium]